MSICYYLTTAGAHSFGRKEGEMRFSLGSLATIFIWVIVLLPTWIFLGARTLVNPEGFWQNIVLFGLRFWILGGIQFILVAFGLAITFLVWMYLYDDR